MPDDPTVPPAAAMDAPGEDIRDIVDPSALPDPLMRLLMVALLVIALLVLAALLWGWLAARRRRLDAPPLPGSPRMNALSELQTLRSSASELAPNDIAARIEDILRVYLHREYGAPAKFSTTDELFGRRRASHEPPPPPEMMRLEAPFRACDHIRFSQTPEADAIAAITGAEHALSESVDPPVTTTSP